MSRAGREEKSFSQALSPSSKCMLLVPSVSTALLLARGRVLTFSSESKPRHDSRPLGREVVPYGER